MPLVRTNSDCKVTSNRTIQFRRDGEMIRTSVDRRPQIDWMFSVTFAWRLRSNPANDRCPHFPLTQRKRPNETLAPLLLSCRREDILSAVAVLARRTPLLGLAICPDR